MKRLVYRSISTLEPDDARMLDIIRACDRDNEPAAISGLLWCDGRRFLHVIEGPDAAVNALFLKLRKDPRHHSLYVTEARRIETRSFPNFEVRIRHGIDAFDPPACGILRTPVGPMRGAAAELVPPPPYPGSLAQAVAGLY